MPHCIIEYSEDLNDNVSEISRAVFSGALASNLFEAGDIKIRAIPYKNYQVGHSATSFVHVSSRLLSGRDSTQKRQLNTAMVDCIKNLNLKNCSITAEAVDIHRESYVKYEV